MYWKTPEDLVALFGIIGAFLLVVTIVVGVIAALKTFQVRQFQDLLFKAERKIDTLERRMFNVLNAVPVALVETDTTGKFTFANKAAHQLLGRKDSELIGLRFHAATWGITYPDGRQVPPDLMPISRTLRGQTVKGFQHMLTNHAGHQKVLVSVTSMPIMNGMGEVIGATAALVEIENETGEGIDDLTGLWRGQWFAAATVPFWGLDASGQILDINNAALDAFDLKRENVLGRNWAQVFVADTDFQTALDYLGDTQDAGDPQTRSGVRLSLRNGDGEATSALVTAWVVRTHEGGENGLTVMAMAAVGNEDLIAVQTNAPAALAAPVAALSDDDLQELADFRAAESALATMGVGTWQYDPEADLIVEDAGMQALIGRASPGGPTLISEDDQARADDAFRSLMDGTSDAIAMDIKVVDTDSRERWITLRGQATTGADGVREIFGVAFDCTEWKAAKAEVQPEVQPSADLDALRTAHETELSELRLAHAAALEAAKAESEERHAQALAAMAEAAPMDGENPTAEPVIIREADPEVLAENAALKAQIEATESELKAASDAREDLAARIAAANDRYDDLAQRYHILSEAPESEPDSATDDAEVAARNAQIATLEAQLAEAETARAEALARLDEVLNAPAPEPVVVTPDVSDYDQRISELQQRLDQASERYDDLAQRYHVLANAPEPEAEPTPEPDFSAHEARISDVVAELETARAERDGWKARYEAVAAAPLPDTSALENELAAARFDLGKWQAAHRDLQLRLEQIAAQPAVDQAPLEIRIEELQGALAQAQEQQAAFKARLEEVTAAHSHAQRFETVGRLTGDVAQDFAQMLGVINAALETLARTSENPESTRRLAEAALAAGKRGERLTRQLQAFQSEEF